jgi:hypothetical protein
MGEGRGLSGSRLPRPADWIRSLERKFPDLGGIADPDTFIKFVLAKGLKVTSKAMPAPRGSAVEVLVPERELSLPFVSVRKRW